MKYMLENKNNKIQTVDKILKPIFFVTNKTIWMVYVSFVFSLFSLVTSLPVYAHHVLGRPSYSLNEDSNTPSSMHVETQIGEYFVTYMIFPAFPKPNEPGRINLYAKRIDNSLPFAGSVTFTVQDDSWFSSKLEQLGTQSPDDNVFRQGFIFKESGDYVITAQFFSAGEPYIIDFPLRVGAKSPIGPLVIAALIVLVTLIIVKVTQRKRLLRATVRNAHMEKIQ